VHLQARCSAPCGPPAPAPESAAPAPKLPTWAPDFPPQAVHEFLHGRLVGEGNLLRHLELLGYRLRYAQSPLAEYPYRVTNLAVDLRDGLRLVRLAELLAGEGPRAGLGGGHGETGLRGAARWAWLGKGVGRHALQRASSGGKLKPEEPAAGCPVSARKPGMPPPRALLPTPSDADGLSQQARFPADRRPLALHNVGLALGALRAAGVPTDTLPTARGLVALRPEDVVDGDRDRSLALLWAVARALQLPQLLRPATLRAEVARVLASGRRAAPRAGKRPEAPLGVYMNDELAGQLMEWAAAVAGRYGVAVRNFTTCFGDGRVLCLLVRGRWRRARLRARRAGGGGASHAGWSSRAPRAAASEGKPLPPPAQTPRRLVSDLLVKAARLRQRAGPCPPGPLPCPPPPSQVAYYLPNALDASSIYAPDPSAGPPPAPEAEPLGGSEALAPGGWCAAFDAAGCVRDAAADAHRAGVAANFSAVHRAARTLGGVPEMLSPSDWAEHGPDERAVMLYLGFLCARLLDCSKEERAAHAIQSAWRESRARRAGEAPRLERGGRPAAGQPRPAACVRRGCSLPVLAAQARPSPTCALPVPAPPRPPRRPPGAARAHLQTWVAAAAVVTRAAKAWLFRRSVASLLSEVAQMRGASLALQSAWRGRAARAEVARRHSAAATIQVGTWAGQAAGGRPGTASNAGALNRRPGITAVYGQPPAWSKNCTSPRPPPQRAWRAALTGGRKARAATAIQAAWRGHTARQRFGWMHRYLARCLVAHGTLAADRCAQGSRAGASPPLPAREGCRKERPQSRLRTLCASRGRASAAAVG
jgi:hypothetical protein